MIHLITTVGRSRSMIRTNILVVALFIAPHLAMADTPPPQDIRSPRQTDKALLEQWRQGRGASMRDALELTGPTHLLYAPAVLDQLHLTDEQIAQVQATQEAFKAKRFEAFQQALKSGIGHPMSEANRLTREATEAASRAVNQQMAEALVQLLDADQRRRLWQIGLLVEGSLVLAWPPIPAELELTPAQLAQIGAVWDRFRATKRGYDIARDEILYEPQGGAPGEYLSTEALRQRIKEKGFTWMVEQIEAARARANEQVAAILSPDQRRKLEGLRLISVDVSDLIRPGGGKWRPEEAERYWEERKAQKVREQRKSDEKD
jgi:hypothetical protein